MRIIKEGTKWPETEITCSHCQSELAYDARDRRAYYAEWYQELYIVCPVCGKRIVLQHISAGG